MLTVSLPFVYAAGDKMPVLGAATRNGNTTLGAGVVIRTVLESIASTLLTFFGLKARAGASAAKTWFNELTTAAAVRSCQSVNLTPCRIEKSHVVGLDCFHEVASEGIIF